MRKIATLLLIPVFAASCSLVKVSADYDRKGEFESYKTYTYTPEAISTPLNGVSPNLLLELIDGEMTAKGFTRTDNRPDVLIDIKIKTKDLETVNVSPGGYYYGYDYMYMWSGSFTTSTINFDNYTDGTLFIDMIDASKKQLVWQGRCTKTLDPKASQNTREVNLSNAVKKIFTRYPPRI